jgi:hypothetical protein
VVVVHEVSRPAIEASLGWVLSSASRNRMSSAIFDQVTKTCTSATTPEAKVPDALCVNGYSTLKALSDWLAPATP